MVDCRFVFSPLLHGLLPHNQVAFFPQKVFDCRLKEAEFERMFADDTVHQHPILSLCALPRVHEGRLIVVTGWRSCFKEKREQKE